MSFHKMIISKLFFSSTIRPTTKAPVKPPPVALKKDFGRQAPRVVAKQDTAKDGYDYPKPAVKFDLPK